MSKTETKVLPLGRPRATAYLDQIEKREGKRRRNAVEKQARELAAEAGQRVVRFEFVALAAEVPLEQMVAELRELGIRTRPDDVRIGKLTAPKAKAPAKPKTPAKPAPTKAAAKDGPGNAQTAPAKNGSPRKTKAVAKPDPKPSAKTSTGSRKPSASSPKPSARSGRAASSSRTSKTAQMRRQREEKASAAS